MKNRYFIYYLLLVVIFLSSSCGPKFIATKELGITLKDGSSITPNSNTTVQTLEFKNSREARQYAMERRLLILRKFETMIEPYFGTVNAKSCRENIKADFLVNNPDHFAAVVEILTQGEERVLHDCLIKNNTHWAHIEFLTCGNTFYDVRSYSSVNEKRTTYEQRYICRK